jgi:hypothetical protein
MASLRKSLTRLQIALVAVCSRKPAGRPLSLEQQERLSRLIVDTERLIVMNAGDPLVDDARATVSAARKALVGDVDSATLGVLNLDYMNPDFKDMGPVRRGAERRFLQATPPAAPGAGPRRRISADQAAAYKRLRDRIVANEMLHPDYYCFYHAQDPRMRIAADLYKRAYATYHRIRVPDDFHFFRFPTPGDFTFSRYFDVSSFLVEKITKDGMIDDNDGDTKLHIISANLSLFGSINHAGEETFHYFQIGKGQTDLDPSWFVKSFFQKFGFDDSVVSLLMQAGDLIDSSEGSLFQILVPKTSVDDVAYLAHPHGIPFDDELLDDIHAIGDIRYAWQEFAEFDENGDPLLRRRLTREKMNDELTRKLKDPAIRHMSARTIERVKRGEYRPSRVLEEYRRNPAAFVSGERAGLIAHHQRAPDHVGQGKKSKHEVMRILNRPLFMQARVLLSTYHMLRPDGGIKIFRYTTVAPEQMTAYEDLVNLMCSQLIRPQLQRIAY